MANISANSGERLISVTRWLGLNESTEGEAALKPGEAAAMGNFRVTPGGALKKRPGSLDVAELYREFTPVTDTGTRRCVITDSGLNRRRLFPRVEVREDGELSLAGSGVEVTDEEAMDYQGYFLEAEGRVWALSDIEVREAPGSEPLLGGRGAPGELTRFALGAEYERPEGPFFDGPKYVELWPAAEVGPDGVALRGERYLAARARGRETGFWSVNAGGYFMRDGVLWRYYGARAESYEPRRLYNKFACRMNDSGKYFTAGEWKLQTTYQDSSISGWTGFDFDPATGTFSVTGEETPLTAAGERFVAYGARCVKEETVPREDGEGLFVRQYVSDAEGPFEGEEFKYIPGGKLGRVLVAEGSRPQEEDGFAFVAEAVDFVGNSYVVMRRAGEYFMYAPDASDKTEYGRYVYGWYGYPLEVRPSQYSWYLNPVIRERSTERGGPVMGLWSGAVGGRDVICAAANGRLWELAREGDKWRVTDAGALDTAREARIFGFDGRAYIMNGSEYLVWDGERLRPVEGYRPLVAVAVGPQGSGTLLENVNRLTPGRRCLVSPDGESAVYALPEGDVASVDWVRDLTTGMKLRDWTADLAAGTVTFPRPPAAGVDTLEVAWSAKTSRRGEVLGMRFAELFNGSQDTRVFIYGDGSNRALYSGIDHEGRGRADYFPDLYELTVGDANTPITAMIRHYDKLLAFKPDSAWSVGYDAITLEDGSVTAGFYIAPVNRSIGCAVFGGAELAGNRPRTIDGESVMEWLPTGSSGLTGDPRNAQRVSGKVERTLRSFDLGRVRTFYDKFSHEYYVLSTDGRALVQDLETGAWYLYTGLDATALINYGEELYSGTSYGALRRYSQEYLTDNGEAIPAFWESGAMDLGVDIRRKYLADLWVGVVPEGHGYLKVRASSQCGCHGAAAEFDGEGMPGETSLRRLKLRVRRFTFLKLRFENSRPDTTATVVSMELRVRAGGYIR